MKNLSCSMITSQACQQLEVFGYLHYFSHKRVSLLDGGLDKWKKEGYPVETKTNPFVKTNYRGKPNPKVLATAGEIEKSIGKKGTALLDARTKEEFEGIHVRAARAGHIPSAINIDWEENIQGGSFKTKEELSKLYSKIPKDSKVVTYCQGGYRAASLHLWRSTSSGTKM